MAVYTLGDVAKEVSNQYAERMSKGEKNKDLFKEIVRTQFKKYGEKFGYEDERSFCGIISRIMKSKKKKVQPIQPEITAAVSKPKKKKFKNSLGWEGSTMYYEYTKELYGLAD